MPWRKPHSRSAEQRKWARHLDFPPVLLPYFSFLNQTFFTEFQLNQIPTAEAKINGFYFGRIWAAASAKSVKWKLVISIIMNQMPIQIVWYYIEVNISRPSPGLGQSGNLVTWQRWTKIKPFDWIYFRPSSITTFIRSSSLNSNQLLAISATQGSSSTTSKQSYEEDKKNQNKRCQTRVNWSSRAHSPLFCLPTEMKVING